MLILSRRVNESVMIGDDVTVRILDMKGGQVRLGICAPLSVSVHREEVYARIRAKLRAAGPGRSRDLQRKVAAT